MRSIRNRASSSAAAASGTARLTWWKRTTASTYPRHQYRDVVTLGMGAHAVEHGVTEDIEVGGTGSDDLGQPAQTVVDRMTTLLHEAVGVEHQQGAGLDGDRGGRPGGAEADTEGRVGFAVDVRSLGVRKGEQRRGMTGGDDLDDPGS